MDRLDQELNPDSLAQQSDMLTTTLKCLLYLYETVNGT